MKTPSEMTLAQRRTIIRQFNDRVDAAMVESAPTKAWVRQAVRGGGAPRCPVRLRRLTLDVILRYGDALADLLCQYPDDPAFVQAYDIFIGYQPKDRLNRVDPLRVLTEDAQWADEWGTQWRHAGDGVGASPCSHPLGDWSELDAFLAERMPDPRTPERMDGALPALAKHVKTRYTAGMTHMALFERFHCLRGMENAFGDLRLYPEEADRLLGALTEYMVEMVRRWGQLGGVDGFFLTDDWGTQLSLMISPTLWRQMFAARYRRICEEAHRFEMDVIFHSCGNVTAIVGDLIDAGVDVLDPLQPEAMDLARIAREFGGKVAFSGGISDQELVSFTADQVRDHVRRTIDLLGGPFGNAYIVSPSNTLPPDVPLENLVALFEACRDPS